MRKLKYTHNNNFTKLILKYDYRFWRSYRVRLHEKFNQLRGYNLR